MEKQHPLGLSTKENKKREIGLLAATYMGLEIVIPSGISQTERGRYQMTSLTCRLQTRGSDELIYKIETVTNIENKLMATRGEGGMDKLGD